MLPWQERDAYFREHGPTPAVPYIERSACGCYTEWPTPAMGAAYKCALHTAMAEHEMRELQRRRYTCAMSRQKD
jgi:hypothetical protein